MLRAKYLIGLFVAVSATLLVNEQLRGTNALSTHSDSIARCEQRINSLEARVAALEAALTGKYVPRLTPAAPPRFQSKGEPRHWEKREFNGQTVYVVPLSETVNGSLEF